MYLLVDCLGVQTTAAWTGDNDQVCVIDHIFVFSEILSNFSLDRIAYHRITDFPAHGQAQSGVRCVSGQVEVEMFGPSPLSASEYPAELAGLS